MFEKEKERITVERQLQAVPNPDREPSKKELVLEAVQELKRATAETVARKTSIDLKTVRNAITALLGEGALVKTGEKANGYQVVVPQSQSTKGPGPGPTEGDDLLQDNNGHKSNCLCEECTT